MKKLSFAFSAVVLCLLLSCNDKTDNTASTNEKTASTNESGPSEKAKKNLENTKAVIGLFDKGDFSNAGDYIAADAVDHASPMGGEIKGLDSIKAMFVRMTSTMSNVKNEIVRGTSDDEYSMVWVRQTWTQTKDDPSMGMKAGDEEQSWMTDYADKMMKDRKYVEETYNRLQTQKIFEWAETQVKPEDKELPAEEFTKMVEAHQHHHH